jgi:DNA transposition AAA+ family ATPase
MTTAKSNFGEFGDFPDLSPEILAEIERLSRQPYLELDRVKHCHAWMYELLLSRMTGLLLGESRSGKTVTSKAFAERRNQQAKTKGKRVMPVVYIQAPDKCGSRDLFIKILKALGHRATSGTITDLRERTLDTLEVFQAQMLIIDEANHLKLETFSEVRHIYDEENLGLSVLLVGTTNRLTTVVKRNDQVENRFLESYELDKLDDKEFQQITRIWVRDVLGMSEASNLLKGETLKLLKKTSKKLIGRLDMILRKAAIRSLRKGYKTLDEEVLKQVAKGQAK